MVDNGGHQCIEIGQPCRKSRLVLGRSTLHEGSKRGCERCTGVEGGLVLEDREDRHVWRRTYVGEGCQHRDDRLHLRHVQRWRDTWRLPQWLSFKSHLHRCPAIRQPEHLHNLRYGKGQPCCSYCVIEDLESFELLPRPAVPDFDDRAVRESDDCPLHPRTDDGLGLTPEIVQR